MSATQKVHPSISKREIPLDGEDLPTVCVLCSHDCGLSMDVKGGKIVAIRPDEKNPITQGYMCNKGVTCDKYAHHDQRLEYPMRKRADGTFERIDWDTAISEIGAKMKAIRDEHGPSSLGLVGIGGQANHMDAPYGTSFLRAYGSRKLYNAFAQEKTQHCLIDHWMFDASPTTFFHPDMENTNYLVVMGTNPRISNRGHNATETFKELNKRDDLEMVVLDPRETETTRGADRHIQLKAGTDAFFMLGMGASIVQNEQFDAEFLSGNTQGFNELRDLLARVDVGEMAERAGVTKEELVETATGFATAPKSAIMYDLGIEQIPFSTLVSYLIRMNCVLTGNLGVGGNHFIEGFAPPTVSGSRWDEPERALASGIQAIRAVGQFGMFSPTLYPEEVLIDHPERIRATIVEGSNPILSFSDTTAWREAFDKLDLLVVIEPAMTETARHADYILPTPVGYEKWEIAMFPKRYPEIDVQLRPPVIPALGESLPEPEIYARLAEAVGLVEPLPEDLAEIGKPETPEARGAFLMTAMGKAAEAAERGINSESQFLFWVYAGIGHHFDAPSLVAPYGLCQDNAANRTEEVLRVFGEEWRGKSSFELGEELMKTILDNPRGVQIALADMETNIESHIHFEDKMIRIAPQEMLGEMERCLATQFEQDDEYPMTLSAGLRTRWTANTIQRNPEWRKGSGPHCELHITQADAERLGLAKGEIARIETPRGSVELPVAFDKKLQDGYAWFPNGFGARYSADHNVVGELQGANANELTDIADRDPFTGCPHHKAIKARISKVEATAAA
jgi:anaerobic selenocysteine-containing dehydrogenase